MDMPTKKPRVVDLFCGCGGLSKGLELAGFELVGALDKSPKAIECYKDNFSHLTIEQDLSEIEEAVQKIKALNPDVIVGGPPCQDFSLAGKRVEGSRAMLTVQYAKIVQKIRPKYFIMENVAHAQKSDAYKKAKKIFQEAGYALSEQVLDASYYGVPQRRKRLVVAGHLNGQHNQFLAKYLSERASSSPITVKEVFPDFPIEFYYRHPRTYDRRAVFSVDEPAPTIRGVNRPRPQNYRSHANDKSKASNVRALSYKERAQIQTFPSSFHWPELSKSDLEQMIGNAVPVNFAKSIGCSLLDYINDLESGRAGTK